jgi:endonuclease/exonuclease/phosphatase (EEP) superfamily protein YafD
MLVIGAYAGLAFGWLTPIESTESRVWQFGVWVAFMVRTFTFHSGIAVAAVAVYALVFRLWKPLLACVPLLVVTLGPAAMSYVPKEPEPLADGAIKVMTCNLLVGSRSPERAAEYVAAQDPDVVFFQEYTPAAHEVLSRALAARYPFVVTGSRDDAFGQAVYSKLKPVEPAKVFPPSVKVGMSQGSSGMAEPQIRMVVEIAGREVVLQNVHDMPPASLSLLQEQVRYFEWLHAFAGSERRPVIIAGDFNSTGSSTGMQRMGELGYRDAYDLAGHGRGSTWVDVTLLRHLPGVRIDHVLVSGELSCDVAEVGPSLGSDHRPVVARVGFVKGR